MNIAEFLTLIVSALLSLAFAYVPLLRDKFDLLLPEYKRLIMLALLLVIAAASYAAACAGFAPDFGIPVTCDRVGVVELVKALLIAIGANQTAYGVVRASSPKQPVRVTKR